MTTLVPARTEFSPPQSAQPFGRYRVVVFDFDRKAEVMKENLCLLAVHIDAASPSLLELSYDGQVEFLRPFCPEWHKTNGDENGATLVRGQARLEDRGE
jgi:hypothetical protein